METLAASGTAQPVEFAERIIPLLLLSAKAIRQLFCENNVELVKLLVDAECILQLI